MQDDKCERVGILCFFFGMFTFGSRIYCSRFYFLSMKDDVREFHEITYNCRRCGKAVKKIWFVDGKWHCEACKELASTNAR